MSSKQDIIIHLDSIDVEDIIAQIHTRVAARGYDMEEIRSLNDPLTVTRARAAGGGNFNLDNDLAYMGSLSYILYWWEMPERGLKGFLKKVMRKLLFFYMKHVIDQQNKYNAAVLQTANDLNAHMKYMESTLATRINELEARLLVLEPYEQEAEAGALSGKKEPSK